MGHHQGRRRLEALDEETALVVDGGAHRPAHHAEALVAEPAAGRVEQRARHRLLVHRLEEAVESHPVSVLAGVRIVLDGGDAADHTPVVLGEKVLGFGVLKERVLGGR